MKVLPVIVLYKTKLNGSQSVCSLLAQNIGVLGIDKIFVYDNSPVASPQQPGTDAAAVEVIYHHDRQNSGVSRAYNTAARYASEQGYDWLLLLDQDTLLPDGALERYRDAMLLHPQLPLFAPVLKTQQGAICSPCEYRFHRGFSPKEVHRGLADFRHWAPINSCMMVSTEKLLEVGGYNERAFLDFSDFQFIERLRKKYSQFYIVDFVATQDFSNDTRDVSALARRFKLYCQCALGCERDSALDSLQYLMIVTLRMLKLTARTRNLDFLKIFIKGYIFRRSEEV